MASDERTPFVDTDAEREARIREMPFAVRKPQIVVIGDAFVDEYVYAKRIRLNPEAPTLCVTEDRRETTAGGAANVAANLEAMLDGVANVWVAFHPTNRPIKRRYVIDGRIVFRADYGDKTSGLSVENVRRACDGATAIVVADYGKGAVTDEVWRAVAEAGVPVFAHTKTGPDVLHVPGGMAPDVTWFVNRAEYNRHKRPYDEWAIPLHTPLVVTEGSQGAWARKGHNDIVVGAYPANVVDVCGAGDSFMAAYVAARVRGERDVERLLRAGCAAGAVAVERFGTSVVSWGDVLKRLQDHAIVETFGCGFATRAEYDMQEGVDWEAIL